MKLSNPTKSPTMPARTWKPANMTRAAYQAFSGGTFEFTAQVGGGMHVHIALSDAEMDALIEHREYARKKIAEGEPGSTEKTWYGTSFYNIDDTPLVPGTRTANNFDA